MAKKISQLTQATQVKSDDVTVIVQDGETKKLPLNMMVTKQDIENKKVAGLAKLDEIEATYENDTYTPTITVKNKSSVKVGEGDGVDYSANVMDGHAKSAILKGQTLVNICKPYEFDIQTTGSGLRHIYDKNHVFNIPIQDDKQYSIWIEIDINEIGAFSLSHTGASSTLVFDSITGLTLTHGSTIIYPCVKRSNSTNVNFSIGALYGSTEGRLKGRIMVFEGDIRGFELSYFTGMQSVKMPVLTTTGKNLFNEKYQNLSDFTYDEDGIQLKTNKRLVFQNPVKIQANKTYIGLIEYSGECKSRGMGFNDVNQKGLYPTYGVPVVNSSEVKVKQVKFTPTSDTYLVSIHNGFEYDGALSPKIHKVAIFESSNINESYEPYKSNILTVNEDVTLRSNGSVCDELDLLTGKLTQRIDEDGDILAQEVVKTVDLIPSGTHPSTTPYCWKDGHIQLSSSGLLPSLEYSVVTSRAGQISQNAAMIVKNDKRIFDLEILLAGGLVNTTYQALTLQNQVETGLSKVSLSSEKEPDYLLYHMIMKLIEEKAYKLDDLAEKVSVFYLYEKLSDEQFETIYSELYPFVEEEYIELPEDGEIIEEPIVDEVLEEVENGVVM